MEPSAFSSLFRDFATVSCSPIHRADSASCDPTHGPVIRIPDTYFVRSTMLHPKLWPLLIGITLGVTPLVAQGGPPGGGMGGGPPGGGRRGPMGGRPVEMPSADLIQGPYEPDSMIRKFALDSAQGVRYRAAWDSMMAATRPRRDSVHQAMGALRRARTEGYHEEGQRQAEIVRKVGKALAKDEEQFDKVIRKFLSKDQWEDFKDWRERRRETEKEMRQQEMQRMGPGGSGGRHPPR